VSTDIFLKFKRGEIHKEEPLSSLGTETPRRGGSSSVQKKRLSRRVERNGYGGEKVISPRSPRQPAGEKKKMI